MAAYRIVNASGSLELLNRQSTHGTASCYLDVDATGKTVVVANYSTGSVAALPVLEETQVTLALEPLGPSEGDFLLTAADGVELMQMIDSPWVRLHLDCKAMSSEQDSIPDLLHRYRSEMVHFHANDPNRLGPGFGELDFAPIMAALNEIEYQGWVSVEVFDYSPGAETLAKKSIENLKRALAGAR